MLTRSFISLCLCFTALHCLGAILPNASKIHCSLMQAVYQVGILLVLNFKGRTILGLSHGPRANAVDVKAVIFNAFVLCQIFNEFNARKPEEFNIFGGVTTNNLFMAIVAITFELQIIIMEFLGKFTSPVRLNWKVWLVSLGIGVISWALAILEKLIPVPDTPLGEYFASPFRRCHGGDLPM